MSFVFSGHLRWLTQKSGRRCSLKLAVNLQVSRIVAGFISTVFAMSSRVISLFVFRAFEAYKTIQIAAPARVCGFLPSAIYKLDKLSEVILLAFTMSGGSSSVLQACSATFEA